VPVERRSPNPRGSGEQLRGQLITAARDLLLVPREPTVLSLRAVARAVGVSPAAVYLHFASVEQLVLAVVVNQHDALREALTAHDSGLHALALGYVEWALANPGAYQLLFESADRLGHRGGPGAPGWDMIESLAELLARDRAWDPERSQHVAVRLWACLHGLVSLRIHKPGVDWPTTPQHEAGQIVRALLEAG
jgi:AcrR family transcriptional regulator